MKSKYNETVGEWVNAIISMGTRNLFSSYSELANGTLTVIHLITICQ